MHFTRLFPGQDRRLREKDSGNQTAPHPDFGGVEFPRGSSIGTESVCGIGDQEAKPNCASSKLSAVQKPCDKMTEAIVMDGGKRGSLFGGLALTTDVQLLLEQFIEGDLTEDQLVNAFFGR
jgi:hypothetical protein